MQLYFLPAISFTIITIIIIIIIIIMFLWTFAVWNKIRLIDWLYVNFRCVV